MSRDWESIFRGWAQPLGKTEKERCSNAEKAIKNAISRSQKLSQRNIKVFTQGSYGNRTNVKKDSDVDIGILCYDTFYMDLPEGHTQEDFGIIDATYEYMEFKSEVEEALLTILGNGLCIEAIRLLI